MRDAASVGDFFAVNHAFLLSVGFGRMFFQPRAWVNQNMHRFGLKRTAMRRLFGGVTAVLAGGQAMIHWGSRGSI